MFQKKYLELFAILFFSAVFAFVMIPKEYLQERFLYIGTGDTAVYAAGALGYLNDSWNYPPLNSNLLGPDQLSVTLFDSIPLAALLTKVINTVFGVQILNYIGIWTLFVYFMQPLSVWLATKTWKINSYPIVIGTILAVTFFESFQFRILHNALQSHFLLILAIGLYPKIINCGLDKRSKIFRLAYLLVFISTLVHTYLATMVFLILGLSFLEHTLKIKSSKLKKLYDFSYFTFVLSLIFIISYTIQGVFGFTATKGGWHIYSMNPLSPFIPRGDRFVEGQYEGLNYLGAFGLFLLFAIYVLPKFKNFKSLQSQAYLNNQEFGFRKTTKLFFHLNWLLSLGSIIYLGSDKIIEYRWIENLPFIETFTSSFRAPGRLFWMNSYFALLLGGKMLDIYFTSKTSLTKNNKIRYAIKPIEINLLIFVLIVFQLLFSLPRTIETYKFMRNENNYQSLALTFFPSVSQSERVIVFPEFECLKPPGSDIISYFHIAASSSGKYINTTKASRQDLPYSCNGNDLNLRYENYFKNSNDRTLLVLIDEWALKSKEKIVDPICGMLTNIYYCYGFKKLS